MKLLRRRNLTPEELASIVGPLAQVCNISSVHLFGSRATGDYRRDSDYDFLITVNEHYGYHDYCRFADGLEEALGRPVDIVNESCLKDDNFSRKIRREAVRVCRSYEVHDRTIPDAPGPLIFGHRNCRTL